MTFLFGQLSQFPFLATHPKIRVLPTTPKVPLQLENGANATTTQDGILSLALPTTGAVGRGLISQVHHLPLIQTSMMVNSATLTQVELDAELNGIQIRADFNTEMARVFNLLPTAAATAASGSAAGQLPPHQDDPATTPNLVKFNYISLPQVFSLFNDTNSAPTSSTTHHQPLDTSAKQRLDQESMWYHLLSSPHPTIVHSFLQLVLFALDNNFFCRQEQHQGTTDQQIPTQQIQSELDFIQTILATFPTTSHGNSAATTTHICPKTSSTSFDEFQSNKILVDLKLIELRAEVLRVQLHCGHGS